MQQSGLRVSAPAALARRPWAAAILAALCLAAVRSACADQNVAGDVIAVHTWAYGTPPDEGRRDLFLKDDVYVRERLETVTDGALHVHLMDDTVLRLGSATSVVLDQFIYAPDADATTLLANLSKGVCRFLTGKTAKKDVKVVTPAATIAARGTVFSVWVKDDGSTTVWVQEGHVDVTPNDGSALATVGAGGIVLAPVGGGGIRLDAPRPAPDPGIADTAHILMFRKKSIR
jgi:hypothetical protein